jgi:proline iminopeptidase
LPEDVQQTLTEHEEAGTTDSDEYEQASAEFYKRHVYGGERPEPPAACNGVVWSELIYEHMWGPTEFYATGTLENFDVSARLHEIDVPVLFMTGEFDEARPETVREFQKQVRGSKLQVIKDAAHASLSRQPEEYRRVLEEFLDSVDVK